MTKQLKEKRVKLINFAFELGVCSQCFYAEKRQDRKTCEKCAEINRKNIQKRRLRIGYCVRCGKKFTEKDNKNLKTCNKCRKYIKEKTKEKKVCQS